MTLVTVCITAEELEFLDQFFTFFQFLQKLLTQKSISRKVSGKYQIIKIQQKTNIQSIYNTIQYIILYSIKPKDYFAINHAFVASQSLWFYLNSKVTSNNNIK